MTLDSDWIAARLSFRTDSKGGAAKPLDDNSFNELVLKLGAKPLPRLVLLIHGYNNDFVDGVKSYENGFKECQREIAIRRDNEPIADNRVFGEIFWPGDANWGLLSVLFYMQSIKNALTTVDLLADVINKLCQQLPNLQIEIVAHSMGCRLSVEVLNRLPNSREKIKCVVLMAAAVPTFKLENNGVLRNVIENVNVKSLFSNKDKVLSFAFPLGQTLAPGNEGILPTALGHNFWPSGLAKFDVGQSEIRDADHSDYWGWEQDTDKHQIGLAANEKVRDLLGLSNSVTRASMRYISDAREGVAQRDILSRRL